MSREVGLQMHFVGSSTFQVDGWMRNDLTGQIFGRLTVAWPAGKTKNCGHVLWLAFCSCGEFVTVWSNNLRSGRTQSCGCLGREQITKHGHARGYRVTPEYMSWAAMLQRCTNPNTSNYSRYGGRGVTVCDRWTGEHGFENFLADMGLRPEGTTMDRFPDKNGNYEPGNCRWATAKEQARNTRTVKLDMKKVREIRRLAATGISQRRISQHQTYAVYAQAHHRPPKRCVKDTDWNVVLSIKE